MAFSRSAKPKKQRKARYTAPLHARQKLAHAHVSKEAREKAKITARSAGVRKGDRVKITKGKFSGQAGRVSRVDLGVPRVFVEGAIARKAKGQEVLVGIAPCNICIMDFDMSDKKRKAILERKGKAGGAAMSARAPA